MQEKIIICVGVEYIVYVPHVSQLCVFAAVYRVRHRCVCRTVQSELLSCALRQCQSNITASQSLARLTR